MFSKYNLSFGLSIYIHLNNLNQIITVNHRHEINQVSELKLHTCGKVGASIGTS